VVGREVGEIVGGIGVGVGVVGSGVGVGETGIGVGITSKLHPNSSGRVTPIHQAYCMRFLSFI